MPPATPASRADRRRLALRAAAALAPLAAAGCRSYPLHSLKTDAEIHARVGEHFARGMSYDQVNSTLTDLRVSETYRHTYAERPPREMVARLFPPGGFWLDRDSEHVRWVDLTFAFDAGDSLESVWTSRGGARYIDGWPVTITPPPIDNLRRYYPAPPAPPETPPHDSPVALSETPHPSAPPPSD